MIRLRRFALIAIVSLISCGVAFGAGDESVKLTRHGNTVEVSVGGKPFSTYYFGREAPKPYLHPLRTAQGAIITRGFPMIKNVPGESHDHPHHRAMYFAHGDINGIDFWAEQPESRAQQTAGGQYYASNGELPQGRTVFRKLEKITGGSHSGTLRALFDLVGPDGKPLGEERQTYTFRGGEDSRSIDCEFTIIANHGPLKMGDTKEGTFAIRVAQNLTEPQGLMLNSNGKTGEKEIWGHRADWVDYSGTVEGEKLGIAIFDNPKNLRHPSTWHARGYGLFAVNPFGEHDFYNDPKRDGSFAIEPGKSLTLRYRVLIHHGDARDARVAEAYQDYSSGK